LRGGIRPERRETRKRKLEKGRERRERRERRREEEKRRRGKGKENSRYASENGGEEEKKKVHNRKNWVGHATIRVMLQGGAGILVLFHAGWRRMDCFSYTER